MIFFLLEVNTINIYRKKGYILEPANPLISFPSPVIKVEWQRPQLFIPTAVWLDDFLIEESTALITKRDVIK